MLFSICRKILSLSVGLRVYHGLGLITVESLFGFRVY